MGDFGQADWSAGIVRATARDKIPSNGVYDLSNFLLDDDGNLYQRGLNTYYSNPAFGTALAGLWESGFTAGRRTLLAKPVGTGGLAVLDGSLSPVQISTAPILPAAAAQLGDFLLIPSTDPAGGVWFMVYAGSRKSAVYTPPAGAGVVTNGSPTVTWPGAAFSANVDAGMIFIGGVGSKDAYVVKSVDSNTQLTLTEKYREATSAIANATLSPATPTNPLSGQATSAIAAVAGRLALGAGRRVYLSQTRSPTTGASRWVPGLYAWDETAYHEFPGNVAGLGVLGERLFVFTEAGMYAIDGLAFEIVDAYGNPQHRVSKVAGDLLLLSPAGLCPWREHLVVCAKDGVYVLSSTGDLELVSRSITPLWQKAVTASTLGMVAVYRDHLFVPTAGGGGEGATTYVARLDRRVRTAVGLSAPWSSVTGQGTPKAYVVANPLTGPTLLHACDTSGKVLDCSGYVAPALSGSQPTDADGSHPGATAITRTFTVAGGALADLKDVVLDYVLGYGTVTVGVSPDDWPTSGTGLANTAGVNSSTMAPRVLAANRQLRRASLYLIFAGSAGSKLRALTGRVRDYGRAR